MEEESAGCRGLSEPSGPSLSVCAVSDVVSTIAKGVGRGVVNVLELGECKIGVCGVDVAVCDGWGVCGRSRGGEELRAAYRDIMTKKHLSGR